MSNQTLQRSSTKRRTRGKRGGSTGGFRRQSARLEGRRDGQPLIFGWGAHLTRTQKTRIQRRAAYSFFGVVIAAVLGVFVFGWLQQNVIIPNQAIVTVNGTKVSQDTYRKMLAYEAQDLWNTLQSELTEQAGLLSKVQSGDPAAIQRNTVLTQQIQTNEANFQQAQITQGVISDLISNQLIEQGARRFEQQQHVSASTFEPSSADIDKALATFKAAFPKNETYAAFLQKDNLTTADVRTAIVIKLRRQLMQTYLAAQYKSPALQVHLRRIETSNAASAQKVLAAIKKDPSDATWTTLAKQDSLDPNTKNTGGDMGWLAPGIGDGAIEQWAFAQGRKAGDISPVIYDTSGTYDVVQVLEVDPSRVVSADTLKAAQDNALSHWLGTEQALSKNHITTPSQDMLTASRNMPVVPNLNAQLPNENPNPTGSSPGGAGIP